MAIDWLDYYTCPSSCWLLWLPCWKNVLHEDVSRKVQTAGELAAGGGSQTENRAASTIVSDTHTNVPQGYFITHLYTKFICKTHLLLSDFFLTQQFDQHCSVGDERLRHPVIWTSLPATRGLQPGGLQYGVTHTNGPIRPHQCSRQALFCQDHCHVKGAKFLYPSTSLSRFKNISF